MAGEQSPIKGACNCGAISVTVPGDKWPGSSTLCHCLNCRASSGSLATLNLIIPTASITVTGTPKTYIETECASGGAMERKFCGDCGSAVMSIAEAKKDVAFVKSGLFVKGLAAGRGKPNARQIPPPEMESWWRRAESWESKGDGWKVVN